MIYYRWFETKDSHHKYYWEGWFLFDIIPIYVRMTGSDKL